MEQKKKLYFLDNWKFLISSFLEKYSHPLIFVYFVLFYFSKHLQFFLIKDYVFFQNSCSCYANAVLQCLACTPPLTAYLLQGLHSKACRFLIIIYITGSILLQIIESLVLLIVPLYQLPFPL